MPFGHAKQDTLSGLILDLRNNGGGLLDEAVRIMDFFVEKGEVIVTTKGKLFDKNHTYRTSQPPIDANIPIVVLINSNSASASEIVSGAMQDLDRGVLVGERTFGKGLVQNILPLSYQTKAKITVAKYYIPSGRCIQEIDYSNKNGGDEFEKVPDSLIKTFRTKNGRSVTDAREFIPILKSGPKNPAGWLLHYTEKTWCLTLPHVSNSSTIPLNRQGLLSSPMKFMMIFWRFSAIKNSNIPLKQRKSLTCLKQHPKKKAIFNGLNQFMTV